MQRCLDDVLDDGRFLDIIRERLSEWDGDVDDDQFVAVWSAADYRLKFYNSLSNGNMKIENLMMQISSAPSRFFLLLPS